MLIYRVAFIDPAAVPQLLQTVARRWLFIVDRSLKFKEGRAA